MQTLNREQAGDKTEINSMHEACGFGYLVVGYDDVVQNPVIYRGKDTAEMLLKALKLEKYKIYMDTDSLLVDIKTEDACKDMLEMKDDYDTSDYPKDNPLYNETNKKVIGKMKDECTGIPISEYVGLRPKMYAIMRSDDLLIKKAKGVKKYVIIKKD